MPEIVTAALRKRLKPSIALTLDLMDIHDQVANLFMHCRYHIDAKQKRALRTQAFETWESVTCAPMVERLAD
jgi:hypothetical protein